MRALYVASLRNARRYDSAALDAAFSPAVATSALAAVTPARAARTRCDAAGSTRVCDTWPRTSQKRTGPMIWPLGSSSGLSPAGAGKLKPKLALFTVWLVHEGDRP